MADFRLVVRGEGVYLNRAQDEAIQELGAKTGGTLSVELYGDGVVLVIPPDGRKLVCFSDGRVERPS